MNAYLACTSHVLLRSQKACGAVCCRFLNIHNYNMTQTELLVTIFAMFEGTAVPSSASAWIRTAKQAPLRCRLKTLRKVLKSPIQEPNWEGFTKAQRQWGMVVTRMTLQAFANSMHGKETYDSRRFGKHHRIVLCTLPADQQWQGGNGEIVQQQA